MVLIPTRSLFAACAISAALLVAGCFAGGDRGGESSGPTGGEVFLQPVAEQGPDPFTASTSTAAAPRPPVTRTPQPTPSEAEGARSLSGATPGLYGGTRNAGSCDVGKQIRFLGADGGRTRAFAQASGISPGSVPDYLSGLTPVVLRADTRVTDHGYGDGRATGFQAVLQAGTAVLVDNLGVPRVRCACGNPLGRPTALDGDPGVRGTPWSGYRAARVVVVTPAPVVITDLTIVDVDDDTWIGRPVGLDGHRHDHVVPPPDGSAPVPSPDDSTGAAPGDGSPSPDASASDCVTPTATDEPTATGEPETPTATESVPPGPGETAPGETDGPGTGPFGLPTDGSALDVSRQRASSSPPADASPDCATASAAPTASEPGTGPAPSGGTTAPRSDPAAPDRSGSPAPSASRVPPTETGTPTEDTGPDVDPDSPDEPDGGGPIPDETTGTDGVFDVSADLGDG
ncbi:DUF6777 domain-containing protein [Streptomyces sp. NPDC002580]|uniref:DUF6777 domain-containing protein n=1 Tax=Streptomyces sp. NPDC002580 TaxID=3364653 RepID=UPI0036C3FC71